MKRKTSFFLHFSYFKGNRRDFYIVEWIDDEKKKRRICFSFFFLNNRTVVFIFDGPCNLFFIDDKPSFIGRPSTLSVPSFFYRVFFFSLPAKPAWWKGKKNSVGKKNNRKEMRKKQKMDDRRRRRPCYRRPMGRGPRHPSAAVDPIGETQYHLPIENSVHPIKKRPKYISFPKISKKKKSY